jgi:hypothetical protein
MNFFDHQDAAKRATRRLVVLFVLSLIGVGVLLYVPVAIAMASEAAKRESSPKPKGISSSTRSWSRAPRVRMR